MTSFLRIPALNANPLRRTYLFIYHYVGIEKQKNERKKKKEKTHGV